MSMYENLVMKTQMNYSRYYGVYASGKSPYKNSDKVIPYEEQISILAKQIREAECIIVGAASGLSASGGGDFYYEASESYQNYFKPFYEKYHFNGAFDGMGHHFDTPNERWGYLATFLHTTQTAPIREPYKDLDAMLKGKDFFILTTNQDTQFVKMYPEEMVSQIQGDHRYFQCSKQCRDYVWDALQPVKQMYEAMDGGTYVPTEFIPHCPHCGAEAFPWVRGYGNFLQGKRYDDEYQKISKYLEKNKNKKLLLIELGVGRMTPMFIQEPFWHLTASLPNAYYVSVNDKYNFLPKNIEEKGIVIVEDIAKVLRDSRVMLEGK